MVDEELILRWFAMRDSLKDYKPHLKRFLNEYMDANKARGEKWLEEREDHFTTTMELILSTLGSRAFRLMDEDGGPLRDAEGKKLPTSVNRALFDAQAIAFSWVQIENGKTKTPAKKVVAEVAKALQDPKLQDAVRRATGDRARIRLRVRRMVGVLRAAGLKVNVPKSVKLDDAVSSA